MAMDDSLTGIAHVDHMQVQGQRTPYLSVEICNVGTINQF